VTCNRRKWRAAEREEKGVLGRQGLRRQLRCWVLGECEREGFDVAARAERAFRGALEQDRFGRRVFGPCVNLGCAADDCRVEADRWPGSQHGWGGGRTWSRIASHISLFAALRALGRSRHSDARPFGASVTCLCRYPRHLAAAPISRADTRHRLVSSQLNACSLACVELAQGSNAGK
jgi:hypothetical protein